ncbi:MAG: hypothetical protein ABL858_06390 [Candidatus Nitrotoga sp.]
MRTLGVESDQEACKQAEMSDSYYRWRKIYGGRKVDQVRKFKLVGLSRTA